MANRGRPAGHMTPLRKKALAVIQDRVAQGERLLVATVVRKVGADRRSAREILGYRDVPADFVERWCWVGWDGARDEFGAHNATIDRWITAHDLQAVANGTPMLHELRREWLEAHYALHHPGKKIRGRKPGLRASRYVTGAQAVGRD